MLTFDEACDAVLKDKEVLMANVASTIGEHYANPNYMALLSSCTYSVAQIMQKAEVKLTPDKDGKKALAMLVDSAEIADVLASIFECGYAVGMAIGRSEDKIEVS